MRFRMIGLTAVWLLGSSCTNERPLQRDLVHDPFPEAQAELKEVVQSIAQDVVSANAERLQAIHLDSQKFTKFGPRSFERQDVERTNESEVAFWGSISDVHYEAKDLKIDVFGDVGVVTYYPQVSFVRGGEEVSLTGRQTLVFLKTADGWKIVHEHGTVRN